MKGWKLMENNLRVYLNYLLKTLKKGKVSKYLDYFLFSIWVNSLITSRKFVIYF